MRQSSRIRLGARMATTIPSPRAPSVPPEDTNAAVESLLIAGYRGMSPFQKLDRVRALNHAVQELALADIRRRHPAPMNGNRRSAWPRAGLSPT